MKPNKPSKRGGFTLVEVMVALAVMTILLVGVMAIFGSMFRAFEQARRTTQAKSIADTVYTAIAERVKYANELWVEDTTGTHTIQISSNSLNCDDVTLGADYFGNYTIAVYMTFNRPSIENFYVEVFLDEELVYKTDGAALKLRNFDILIEGSDEQAFPQTSDPLAEQTPIGLISYNTYDPS